MSKRTVNLVGLLGVACWACSSPGSSPPPPAALVAPALPPPQGGMVIDEVAPKREIPVRRAPSPAPVDPNSLQVGAQGQEVLELESRLEAMRYRVGKVDGSFDRATFHGVMAFQKVEGLPRTGRADGVTRARIQGAASPAPRYSTPPDHIEVDLARQVVLVVTGGSVSAVLPASSGSGKMFRSQGWSRRAITPNGQFQITRKINAMRISPLGKLYKPSYFNGGIALHGNPSVPAFPASHGCVRLPMQFADWFFNEASPVGRVVYVYGGPSGPNPQPFVDDAPDPAGTLPAGAPSGPAPLLPLLQAPSPSPATPAPSPTPPTMPVPGPSPQPAPSPAGPGPEASPTPATSPPAGAGGV